MIRQPRDAAADSAATMPWARAAARSQIALIDRLLRIFPQQCPLQSISRYSPQQFSRSSDALHAAPITVDAIAPPVETYVTPTHGSGSHRPALNATGATHAARRKRHELPKLATLEPRAATVANMWRHHDGSVAFPVPPPHPAGAKWGPTSENITSEQCLDPRMTISPRFKH
ncbi:hypothetical protein ACFPIJ_57080 [Dactylosporangium cerinum]|uniref:Uncharacterized protein n=1 Tax=Dactylosporangium cerinum TaxID=1434730 RepID=A0ABV9WIA6_9ACTN